MGGCYLARRRPGGSECGESSGMWLGTESALKVHYSAGALRPRIHFGRDTVLCEQPGRNRAGMGVGAVFECGLGVVAMWMAAGMPIRHSSFGEGNRLARTRAVASSVTTW